MRLITITTVIMLVGIALANKDESKATQVQSKEEENVICTLCKCNKEKSIINCSGRKLETSFTSKNWLALNSSSPTMHISFDINVITSIAAFPTINISYLSFKQNDIEHIEHSAFKNLLQLVELDLSNNRLTSDVLVPEIFEGKYDPDTYEPLKKLKVLNLGNNRLHSLDPDIFEHLPNLESLYLDTNPFKLIDETTVTAISTIPRLKFLDMSYMELDHIPEHIFHRPRSLESLNLTGNLLQTVPVALKYAINLKYLLLDENPIESFNKTNALPHLEKLETLSVSFIAPLKTVGEEAFCHLPALNTLIMQFNPHLEYIDAKALSWPGEEDPSRREWPAIKKIYLNNNNLSFVESNLLSNWNDVEVADIRYNPWRCDCQNQWMIATLMPIIIKKMPELSENNVCHRPIEMLNKTLVKLSEKGSQMRCEDVYNHRPERDGAILVGILVGLLIGIPISFGIIVAYKRGCFGLIRQQGPADYSRAFYKRAPQTGENFYI